MRVNEQLDLKTGAVALLQKDTVLYGLYRQLTKVGTGKWS
jgi:hypothetical protein